MPTLAEVKAAANDLLTGLVADIIAGLPSGGNSGGGTGGTGGGPVVTYPVPVILTALSQTVNENIPVSLLIETNPTACTITTRQGYAAELFAIGPDTVGATKFDYEAPPAQAVGKTLTVPLRATRDDNPAVYTDFEMVFTIADVAENVEVGPTTGHGAGANLWLSPFDFSSSDWVKSGTTVVANQGVAPANGLTQADKVYPTETGTFKHVMQKAGVLTVGASYTICVDVEAAGMSIFSIQGGQPLGYGDAFYNLSTGQVSNVGSGITASMIDLGNGRWRCKYVRNASSAANEWIQLAAVDTAGAYTSTTSGTNGVLLSNAYIGTTG